MSRHFLRGREFCVFRQADKRYGTPHSEVRDPRGISLACDLFRVETSTQGFGSSTEKL